MTGASGSFSYRGSGGGTADYTLVIDWRQEYSPGNNYSDVYLSARIDRSGGSATGGTWFAWQDGGISVNGTQVIHWYEKSTSGSWAYAGASVGIGSGSVRVYHTGATTVPLSTTAVDWNNTSVSSASFFFPAKSETLALHAIPQPNTLTISAGAGTTVTVNRTASPMGLDAGVLSSGAAIFAGDVLQITGSPQTGYNLTGLTVNGEPFSSGGSFTASGNVTVAASAALKTYRLTLNPGDGCWITAARNGAALGSGDAVSHFDVLTISAGAKTGYELTGLTVNGKPFSSGGTLTVTGDVTIAATAKQLGLCYIGGVKYLCYINGVQHKPMVGAADGSKWILLS